MNGSRPRAVVWVGIGLFSALCSRAHADMISVIPIKDNTLIEDPAGALSNGGSNGIFAGRVSGNPLRTGMGRIRRAVMEFDLSSIPEGSTVTSVQLRLQLLRAAGGTVTRTMTLHRLLGDWGEGMASDMTGGGGGGAPAAVGDATWLDQFMGTEPWTTPGGDFVTTPSASLGVTTTLASKTFTSTPQLVADVQSWLDSRANNFGWILLGDESTTSTARKFASRTFADASRHPTLLIDFTPPGRIPGDADGDGDVDRDDVAVMALHWGDSSGATVNEGDFTVDGRVGAPDLAVIQTQFGVTEPIPGAQPPPGIPEPATWPVVLLLLAAAAWRHRRWGVTP